MTIIRRFHCMVPQSLRLPLRARAPGDPSPAERDATDQAEPNPSEEERVQRPGFEEPPALADGDKQINPSNRFASLELD